jgi:hypothetical protein
MMEEQMMRARRSLWMICGMIMLVTGCASYYRVNDPAGTREYYTTKIDKTVGGGITFKDEKGGSVVTLQSSEIKEISEEEFNSALKSEVKSEEKKSK